MRFASIGITLVLVSLLSGEQSNKRTFSDCDKSAKTQADLTECAGNDLKSADDELNATYQQLLKKAAGDPFALRKIKAAQRAWVAFRDAQIEAFYPAEDKQKEYGTVFPMCADLRLADLTRERTKMLKETLNSVEGDVCASGISR
jgi:uncharacterized protein YecT (DUF1311 family)